MSSWTCSFLARTPGRQRIRWDIAGLQSAVSRYAAGWVAEIAISWKSLAAAGVSAAPKADDQWRAGLYRIKRPGGPAKADQITALAAERKTAGEERKADRDEAERAARR